MPLSMLQGSRESSGGRKCLYGFLFWKARPVLARTLDGFGGHIAP